MTTTMTTAVFGIATAAMVAAAAFTAPAASAASFAPAAAQPAVTRSAEALPVQKVGKRLNLHIHIGRPRFHPYVVYGGGYYYGCSYYRHMWKKTGLFHWKKKYFICRGWW